MKLHLQAIVLEIATGLSLNMRQSGAFDAVPGETIASNPACGDDRLTVSTISGAVCISSRRRDRGITGKLHNP